MRYRSVNQLDSFEFHDSEFTFVQLDSDVLTVSVKFLNIHKETEQNPSEYDMEIESARISFEGIRKLMFEPSRTWIQDADGNSYTDDPLIIYEGKEAEKHIIEELKNTICVFNFDKEDDFRYSIGACGLDPYLTFTFSFDRVIVEWDNYRKKAWYEQLKLDMSEPKILT